MSKEPFSDQLENWLSLEGHKTFEKLSSEFKEKSFAVLILLLMLPTALPIPTGGLTYIFEITAMLLALEMVIGRSTIWLPEKLKSRKIEISADGRVMKLFLKTMRKLEKYSKPRWDSVLRLKKFLAALGIILFLIILGGTLSPPFTGLDTLPSVGAALICTGVLLEDIAGVFFGVLVGCVGVAISVSVISTAFNFLN